MPEQIASKSAIPVKVTVEIGKFKWEQEVDPITFELVLDLRSIGGSTPPRQSWK